ncbi:MAG TPA: RluA family pseudouridine synthase, partial [Candidatus Sulfotelmatobacter sp.]|nr:RluA family pseudouridine synthase [Candidatus Sulfotelmatobacter sp.]
MIDVNIIYEDEDFLVLDKPSGMIVNKADTTKNEITLQDFLEKRHKYVQDSSDFSKRAGIVHRIDKETSGLLIVAKNLKSFENLQAQFKERKVEKTYIALVHGHVSFDEGEISVPIGRLPWNRKRFGVMVGGKEAQTFYKTIERFNKP